MQHVTPCHSLEAFGVWGEPSTCAHLRALTMRQLAAMRVTARALRSCAATRLPCRPRHPAWIVMAALRCRLNALRA